MYKNSGALLSASFFLHCRPIVKTRIYICPLFHPATREITALKIFFEIYLRNIFKKIFRAFLKKSIVKNAPYRCSI